MTIRTFIDALAGSDSLNFALTNRIPRRTLTRFMGWFSKVEQPLVRDLSIRAFQLFCAPDLSEAKKGTFRSLHDCFVRELKDGARPIDPERAAFAARQRVARGAPSTFHTSTA